MSAARFPMRMAVLLPTKYNLSSTVFSNQIAAFLAKTLGCPLIHEGNYHDQDHDFDVLFIVNYPFAFCGMADHLASMAACAGKIVWVENDYTIVPPKTNHTGPQSPIRKAFGDRKDALIYWTNRPDHAGAAGAYVNWNLLAYQPCNPVAYKARPFAKHVVYYGAFREDRVSSFEQYIHTQGIPPVVFATSTRTAKKFHALGAPDGAVMESLQPMIEGLAKWGASLYLEDDDTHTNYHSPANRYYEALAAGTALLVDAACLPTFQKAGIKLESEWIVRDGYDILTKKRDYEKIADHQMLTLRTDFRKQLITQILTAKAKLCS